MNLLCDANSVFRTIGYVLLAFIVLMVMVLIHETGHYTAGKILGFKISEFSVGMGPKIFSKTKKNGEVFSLRLLPLGGFCAFEGEDDDNKNPKAFNSQKPWKRLIVLVSGALFNFISAILIAIIVFATYGETVAVVNSVYEYAPDTNRQLQQGDIVYKINGKRVYMLDNLTRYLTDEEMTFTVLRPTKEGENTVYNEVTVENIVQSDYCIVVLTKVSEVYSLSEERKLAEQDTLYSVNGMLLSKQGDLENALRQTSDGIVKFTVMDGKNYYDYALPSTEFESKIAADEQSYRGVGMSVGFIKYKFGFGEVMLRVVPYCFEVGMLVLRTLGGLLTGVVGIESIGGPISTIAMTTEIVSTGFGNVLMLIVLISVNLAVFNLLPVPALDGCQMIFVIIEWIAGKPINRKVQNYINGIGFVVLIVLMLLIDLLKL